MMLGMATDDPGRRQLAGQVEQRRVKLGIYTIEEAGRRARISRHTWRSVERGEPVRASTYHAVEEALRWAPGSVQAILAGGEASHAEDSSESREPDSRGQDRQDDGPGAIISAAVGASAFEAAVLAEVRRYPPGTAAEIIFTDPVDQAIWRQSAKSEGKRVREVAAFRAVQPAARAV
jgi:hypothetical protein